MPSHEPEDAWPSSVLHLAWGDGGGGANRAAYRLHRAWCDAGGSSRMLVRKRLSQDPEVLGDATPWQAWLTWARPRLARQLTRCLPASTRSAGGTGGVAGSGAFAVPRSYNLCPTRWAQRVARLAPGLTHVHWVGGETLSIEDLGALPGPRVWTLHDPWAMLGAEHLPAGDSLARCASGYASRGWNDWDAWVWRRKQHAFKRPMHLVAPSQWMAGLVQQSRLMGDWPLRVIPNVLRTDVYSPWPQREARQRLGLPQGVPLLLHGSLEPLAAGYKGWDLLQAALRDLAHRVPDLQLVVFGAAPAPASLSSSPPAARESGLPVHHLGRIDDDARLALVYSAADVLVLPSRIENLPQVATEAQACGVPVVAFDVAGLRDVVQHQHTGALAEAFRPEALADAVCWVLADTPRRQQLSRAARQRALALWSPEAVLPQVRAWYDAAQGRGTA